MILRVLFKGVSLCHKFIFSNPYILTTEWYKPWLFKNRIFELTEFIYYDSLIWVVFNNFLLIDETDRSKSSINHHQIFFDVSLYPHSLFVNTPFKQSLICFYQIENQLITWNGSIIKCTLHYCYGSCSLNYIQNHN